MTRPKFSVADDHPQHEHRHEAAAVQMIGQQIGDDRRENGNGRGEFGKMADRFEWATRKIAA